jgi:hypothetical protein
VPRLGYTVQVLHAALRRCPPAAAIGRMATADIAVDGYRVEAGTMIGVGTDALHRERKIGPLLERDRQHLLGRIEVSENVRHHFTGLEPTLHLITRQAIADDQAIRHSTVPAGTTHWQRWPVTDAIMSKSPS